jgi:hypothetical protein
MTWDRTHVTTTSTATVIPTATPAVVPASDMPDVGLYEVNRMSEGEVRERRGWRERKGGGKMGIHPQHIIASIFRIQSSKMRG